MRFNRNKICIAAAGICLLAGPVSAELLVIRAAGGAESRYSVGQRLDDNLTFVLREGQSVSIVDSRGRTHHLSGPGRFRYAHQNGQASFQNRSAVRAGAVR